MHTDVKLLLDLLSIGVRLEEPHQVSWRLFSSKLCTYPNQSSIYLDFFIFFLLDGHSSTSHHQNLPPIGNLSVPHRQCQYKGGIHQPHDLSVS